MTLELDAAARLDAQGNGSKTYASTRECKRGHIGTRYTINGGCVDCAKRFAPAKVAGGKLRQDLRGARNFILRVPAWFDTTHHIPMLQALQLALDAEVMRWEMAQHARDVAAGLAMPDHPYDNPNK